MYGYVALWETCHVGLPGCQRAPKGSPTDYAYAHTGITLTEEGDEVATANIGGGAGHAPIDHGAPPQFYDNTSTQLMRVKYGEDENGLYFAGALWPDVDDVEVERLRATAISGDWRWFASWRQAGGQYDFAGACLVNIPGYPMEAEGQITTAAGQMRDLVASSKSEVVYEDGSTVTIFSSPVSLSSDANEQEVSSMCDCNKTEETVEAETEEQIAAAAGGSQEQVDAVSMKLDEVLSRLISIEEAMMQVEADRIARKILE